MAGSRLLWAARRLGLGFFATVVLKEGVRAALLAVLPFLYRNFPLAVRRLWQPPMHNLSAPRPQQQQKQGARRGSRRRGAAAAFEDLQQQQPGGAVPDGNAAPAPPMDPRLAALPHNAQGLPWDVDVTSRFFGYAGTGFAVAGVCPRLFQLLQW